MKMPLYIKIDFNSKGRLAAWFSNEWNSYPATTVRGSSVPEVLRNLIKKLKETETSE